MNPRTDELGDLMERASQALSHLDYLTCEAYCLEALQRARAHEDWDYYARILLPLQEARRQRRMIAADGVIRLGTARLEQPVEDWLGQLKTGCIVVSHPHKAEHARTLADEAQRQRRHVEVLFAANPIDDDTWTLRSYAGPEVTALVPAPPKPWRDLWLAPGERPRADDEDDEQITDAVTEPSDWFIRATEALGDAAIDKVTAPEGSLDRIEQLEAMLQVVTDHELLHQRLGDAARAMR